MFKNFAIFFMLLVVSACSTGRNLDKNLEALDKKYGYCDNPQRDLNKQEYKICKDQERAGGEELELTNLTELFRGSRTVIAQSSISPYLWKASLTTMQPYSLKIVDSNGGYIETDWIFDGNVDSQRCSIKVQVLSSELISTGINTNILCQNLINNNWVNDDAQYIEESKQITLAILKKAKENLDLEQLEK
jgi:hypothetical protein